MKKPKILISLTTLDNDYQIEQAAEAHDAARRLGVELQLVYADNNPITQSQQLLKVIQSSSESRLTRSSLSLSGEQACREGPYSAQAGIGWVVVNWDVAYLEELRREFSVPTAPGHGIYLLPPARTRKISLGLLRCIRWM